MYGLMQIQDILQEKSIQITVDATAFQPCFCQTPLRKGFLQSIGWME